MSDAKYGSWETPESPVDVEYSLVVIEEIRQIVSEGYQRLRGGMEVGGLLYGAHEGRVLRLQATRVIACEHARGPSFTLSEKDLAALTAQLECEKEDPRLEGMELLGWFLSHTRSNVNLQAADLETYAAFFPEPWQVTLVVRPGRSGAMRAGFFVREPDGGVKTEQSYLEFNFPDRLAGILDRPPGERPTRERRGPPPRYEAPAHLEETPYANESAVDPRDRAFPQYQNYAEQRPGRGEPLKPAVELSVGPKRMPWVLIVIFVAVILAGVVGFRLYGPKRPAEPLGLAVQERDGKLQVQWNRASQTLVDARSASLNISDGTDKRTVALSGEDLAKGNFTYARRSGDVQVSLVVERSAGDRVTEGSRFLGTPPENIDADEMNLLRVQRDALQDEVTRLLEQNTQQTDRIQQLERTLTIMRGRLGIDQGKR